MPAFIWAPTSALMPESVTMNTALVVPVSPSLTVASLMVIRGAASSLRMVTVP